MLLPLLSTCLALPVFAGSGALHPPTLDELLSQESLLGLSPGDPVDPDRLVAALSREPWVDRARADEQGIRVDLARGPFASVHLELRGEPDARRLTVVAMDAEVAGSPTWTALLGDRRPGEPVGLDAEGHSLWQLGAGLVVATRRDEDGLLRPVGLDAGTRSTWTAVADLSLAFDQDLAAGDLEGALTWIEAMAPFGLGPVVEMSERWRDRRAVLCGTPLVVLANRAAATSGVERRRAARAAVTHALAECRDERGALLSVSQPPLSRLVADLGTLPGVEDMAAWVDLSRGQRPSVAAMQDLAQALHQHRGPGLGAFRDGTWQAADWPARVELLAGLELSLHRATAQERPALEAARTEAREELRRQLVVERDRALADRRLATAEVAQAALLALVGQPPLRPRALTADDDVATWIRSALVAADGPLDPATLLLAAISSNRLDAVGLSLPDGATLIGDPALSWGSVEVGLARAEVRGPEVARQTLVHAWRAPTQVPAPEHQAAVAERTRIAEARASLRAAPAPLVPVPALLLAPGVEAAPFDAQAWRQARAAWLDARLAALDRLAPTTSRTELSVVGFQAEVQRWQGTVQRRLRLSIPAGIIEHEPQVDVSEWRYVRHGANPAVELPAQDQLTTLPAVEARALRELDQGARDDLAALLAEGIGRQAWAMASTVAGSMADRAREAAALHWLLTGREAPDIEGIGFVDGLRPMQARGIPGDALLVRVSPDGERALVLRTPFTFEIHAVEDGRRLLGPYEVQGRVNVVDGDSVSVVFTPGGEAVRAADTAVDLGSGRVLGAEEREAQAWLARYERGIDVDPVDHGGRPHVRVERRLDRAEPAMAPLPRLLGRDWTLDHGVAAPDLDEVAVQLRDAQGLTAVALIDLPDGNVLASWTEGSPRLGETPDGIAITDRDGLRLADWQAHGVRERPAWRRLTAGSSPGEIAGTPLWHPAGVVEVLQDRAIFYSEDGAWQIPFDLPASAGPVLLDEGRILLTRGPGRLFLTPVPSTAEAVR